MKYYSTNFVLLFIIVDNLYNYWLQLFLLVSYNSKNEHIVENLT
jgi:hypothetical protein